MSHEIRTPMNAIVGMCELILRENDISETVKDYCFSIQNSGRSLLSIINDILDFSKIESGKLEIVEEKYEPMSMFHDLSMIFLNRIGEKDIELLLRMIRYKDAFRRGNLITKAVETIKHLDLFMENLRFKLGTKTPYGFNR